MILWCNSRTGVFDTLIGFLINIKIMKELILNILSKYQDANLSSSQARNNIAQELCEETKIYIEKIFMREYFEDV